MATNKEQFYTELHQLLERYDVKVRSHEIYVLDQYRGDNLYLVIKGEPDYTQTLQEILKQYLQEDYRSRKSTKPV